MLVASSLRGLETCTSLRLKLQMQGITHVQWETWWPMLQWSALQLPWWCEGTVNVSGPLSGYFVHWSVTNIVGRGSRGDKSLVSSVTLFFPLTFFGKVFTQVNNSLVHRVMYARKPLDLHEGAHLHNESACSLMHNMELDTMQTYTGPVLFFLFRLALIQI